MVLEKARMRTAIVCGLGAALVFTGVSARMAAQQTKPAAKPAGAAYTPAKTPWGDPRIGGV